MALALSPRPVAQSAKVLDDAKARNAGAPGIRLHDLSHSFGDRCVLSGVDLEVGAGEVVALLGPSGCGKSTLIRLLAGLLPLDAGTRQVQGVQGEMEVGLCFQEPRLLPWRNCVDNVCLPLERTGLAKAARVALAKEMLCLVGLPEAAQLLPHELSGGMKMRVAVARALVKSPGLMLLDEPFAALDAPSRFELQNLLHELVQAHARSVVLVTHSLQEAARLADRAYMMASAPGRIVEAIEFDGPVHERMDTRTPAFARALIELQRGMQAAMEAS